MKNTQIVYTLIRRLSEKKIKIWLEEGALKFKAPKHALDAELRNDLVQYKPDLVAFLKQQKSDITINKAIELRPNQIDLPLSHAQQRLWFIDQSSEYAEKAAYNVPMVLSINGALNVEALNYAVNCLVHRHEILQCYFDNQQGLPKQVKNKTLKLSIPLIDVSHLKEDEKIVQTQYEIEKNIATEFDLSIWPLFKLGLIQQEKDTYILLATMHHIICDAWSMRIFLKELSESYHRYLECTDKATLDDFSNISNTQDKLQYADFAYWQNNYLKEKSTQVHIDFWKDYLKNSSVLELPLDYKRKTDLINPGKKKHFYLDNALKKQLNSLASKHNVTLFMLLSACFTMLLSRFSRQYDINLGIPVANRTHPEWENLIGFFVNTLVLRSDLSENPTFVDFLKQVQGNILAIYSHQDLPFDKIVEALPRKSANGFESLFQVMFSLQNDDSVNTFTLPNVDLEVLNHSVSLSRYDMTWSMVQNEHDITVAIEYNKTIFSEQTITLYTQYFTHLLKAVVCDPSRPIDEYALQDIQETKQQLARFNPDIIDYPREKFIGDIFEEITKQYPLHTALSASLELIRFSNTHDITMTYKKLSLICNHIAEYLLRLGVLAEDRMILMLPRSFEMTQLIISAMKLGVCYVPIDPEYPDERKIYIYQDSSAKFVVTSKALLAKQDYDNFSNATIIFIEDVILNQEEFDALSLEKEKKSIVLENHQATFLHRDSQQLEACIFYTSGSSGKPKGVIVSHRSIVRLVCCSNTAEYGPQEIVAHISNICFDASSMELWGALLHGGTLHIINQNNLLTLNKFSTELQQYNISIMFLTIGLFKLYANERPEMFGGLKNLLIGGEIVDIGASNKVLSSDSPPKRLINSYGPTENTTFTANYDIQQIPDNVLSVPLGRPINHSQVYIADNKGNLLPPGIPGELLCAGDGLAKGYLNKEQLTQEKFITGFIKTLPDTRIYRSGDLARYASNGDIILSGRLDEQIKLRGFRIEPSEIELHLSQSPHIESCSVAIKENSQGSSYLVAYLVLNKNIILSSSRSTIDTDSDKQNNAKGTSLNKQKDLTDIIEQAKKGLPYYMQPSFFIRVDDLPLNSNGKVDKKSLPDPEWSQETRKIHVQPNNKIEEKISSIWEALLDTKNPSIQDNFFSIGGHSLLATQLASRIEDAFKTQCNVKLIFDYPTIESMAKYLASSALNANRVDDIPKAKNSTKAPLSQSQRRLWFIHQLNPNSSVYGMPITIKLTGKFDLNQLEKSLMLLINRHASLRTYFIEEEGQPLQYISKPIANYKLATQYISNKNEIQHAINANQSKTFDLGAGPIFSAELIILNDAVNSSAKDSESFLLMNMHHIISDGWSMRILQNDLLHLYIQGNASQLPELSIQYTDFSHWQASRFDEKFSNQLLNFWLTELNGTDTYLQIPTDKPRPHSQSFSGKVHHHHIDKLLTKRLLTYCKKNELTMFTMGLAAYAIVLSKYSRQRDFCIGIPVSGRNHQSIENLMGFFVNGLVMRSDLRDRLTLKECLALFKHKLVEGFAHQDLSVDRLIDALGIKPNSSYQPLAQVAFSHQNTSDVLLENLQEQLQENGLQFEVLASEHKSAKYDLLLSFGESEDTIELALEYAEDLFNESSIAGFIDHYIYILNSILNNDEILIDQISWVEEAELLATINNSPTLKSKQSDIGLITKAFPLSSNQYGIYLDSLINPQTCENSIGNFIELNFEVDHDCWEKVLMACQQHEIFRTRFFESNILGGETVYQCVSDKAISVFEYEDLSKRNISFEELAYYYESYIYSPYDLLNDVLYGFKLVKLGECHYAGVLKVHHILFDGVTGKIFLEDLLSYYQKLKNKENISPRPDNYDAYITDINKRIDTPECLNYWREKTQYLEALHCNIDNAFIAYQSDTCINKVFGRNKSLTFSQSQSLAINKFCKKYELTAPVFFKSLYSVLIYQYCQPSSDFHLLEYSHGRKKDYIESYGVFYQQTPYVIPIELFKTQLFDNKLMSSLFVHANRFHKDSRPWKALSLQAQNALLPKADIGFMYNYRRFEDSLSIFGTASRTLFMSPRVEKQVQLIVSEQSENYELTLLFSRLHFNELNFLERMQLLAGAIIDEEKDLGPLLLTSDNDLFCSYFSIKPDILIQKKKAEKETEKLLDTSASIDIANVDSVINKELPKPHLLDSFQQFVASDISSKTAVIGSHSLKYEELESKSNELAALLLRKYHISENDKVGLYLKLDEQFIVALFAVIKLGASYVPIDLSYPAKRVSYILQTSRVSLLLTHSNMQESDSSSIENTDNIVSIERHLYKYVCFIDTINFDLSESNKTSISNNSLPASFSQNDRNDSLSENMLYSIFTSGSTGNPKGAQVSYANVENLLTWYESKVQITSQDVCLILSAPGFDLTQKNLFSFLRCGASIIFSDLSLFDADNICQTIEQHQVTHINCAPSVLYSLLQSRCQSNTQDHKTWKQLQSLRYVVLGGEAIVLSELKAWYESDYCHAKIINTYGPTECTDVVCAYDIKSSDFESDIKLRHAGNYLGQPINETNIYVLDTFRNKQIPGLIGEIAIAGTCVGLGYLSNPKLNSECFIDLPLNLNEKASQRVYLTGDLGRINAQGMLEYVGRKDFQIKLRGQRIELGEIETQLRALDNIRDAVTLADNDQLLAYVLKQSPDSSFDLPSIKSKLKESLPNYMIPKFITPLDQWPLNANGKIDRSSLLSLARHNAAKEVIKPINEYEIALVSIWSEVLGIQEISTDDNFFSLGGHSLLATKAVSRMKVHFKIEFPLKALFDLDTLADIAKYIKTLRWAIDSKQNGEALTDDEIGAINAAADPTREQNKPTTKKRDEGFL